MPDTLTVAPVVDYEPPPHAVDTRRRAPLRPHPRRCPGPVASAGRRQPTALTPVLRSAALFTDAALRRVLEVLDRRRPAAQLHPLLAAGLVDSVAAACPVRADRTAAAILQRVRVQAVGATDPLSVVEAFGTYRRGRRVHAVACRIQRAADRAGSDWQMVALHIG